MTGGEDRMKYPIEIHPIKDGEDNYYIAFLPDFGATACSAAGDTPEEALREVKLVALEIIDYYKESDHLKLPEPFSKVKKLNW